MQSMMALIIITEHGQCNLEFRNLGGTTAQTIILVNQDMKRRALTLYPAGGGTKSMAQSTSVSLRH